MIVGVEVGVRVSVGLELEVMVGVEVDTTVGVLEATTTEGVGLGNSGNAWFVWQPVNANIMMDKNGNMINLDPL